jgi:hypothetical protein
MFGSGKGKKVTLEDGVLEKVRVAATILGCSSEEFIAQAVEREAERVIAQTGSKEPTAAEVEEIAQQLKGLGYLE